MPVITDIPLLIDTLLCVFNIHGDLYDTLCHHRFGNFHEARNVCAFHIVDILIFFSVFDALLVDGAHDLMQFGIDFGSRPGNMHGVLSHFQAGSGDTAGIDSLARSKELFVFDEQVDSFGRTSHVGHFGYA